MVMLRDGKFGVEVVLSRYKDEFVQYYFHFVYNGGPLFNHFVPAHLKVFEYDTSEYLIQFFENVALLTEGDGPLFWIADTEKVHIQGGLFYADGWINYFDGPHAEAKDINEKEELLKQMDERRVLNGGLLPDDLFELSFSLFDDKLLRSGDRISGTGSGMRLLVRRDALQTFTDRLKEEFFRQNVEK